MNFSSASDSFRDCLSPYIGSGGEPKNRTRHYIGSAIVANMVVAVCLVELLRNSVADLWKHQQRLANGSARCRGQVEHKVGFEAHCSQRTVPSSVTVEEIATAAPCNRIKFLACSSKPRTNPTFRKCLVQSHGPHARLVGCGGLSPCQPFDLGACPCRVSSTFIADLRPPQLRMHGRMSTFGRHAF